MSRALYNHEKRYQHRFVCYRFSNVGIHDLRHARGTANHESALLFRGRDSVSTFLYPLMDIVKSIESWIQASQHELRSP